MTAICDSHLYSQKHSGELFNSEFRAMIWAINSEQKVQLMPAINNTATNLIVR